ncbi:hypothetical protein DPMN_138812 [Dreissena polymorpha]|uniref:Uncharacterized protein n=1 Tax=Dreissena polymorpha TaxID=45954 RepID=A0A9D4G8C3_DREPO|nr:hypothetical protein DPMN_138812 [Dreissena polymorpha]
MLNNNSTKDKAFDGTTYLYKLLGESRNIHLGYFLSGKVRYKLRNMRRYPDACVRGSDFTRTYESRSEKTGHNTYNRPWEAYIEAIQGMSCVDFYRQLIPESDCCWEEGVPIQGHNRSTSRESARLPSLGGDHLARAEFVL